MDRTIRFSIGNFLGPTRFSLRTVPPPAAFLASQHRPMAAPKIWQIWTPWSATFREPPQEKGQVSLTLATENYKAAVRACATYPHALARERDARQGSVEAGQTRHRNAHGDRRGFQQQARALNVRMQAV